MASSPKLRLDELLVSRGLAETRTQAKGLILSGKVRHGTTILDKPGKEIPSDTELTIIAPPRFVSRGGEKLQGFLDAHPIPLSGLDALDVGASTGGFTDCLLQNGVVHVTCVDVGYGQLHAKLRNDPRITNLERVNARQITPDLLPKPHYDIIVMDVSFISQTKILPHIWPFLKPNGHLITLIKPQFEATKQEADKGQGIIRDPAIHQRIITEILDFAATQLPNSHHLALTTSSIQGTDGNTEFLAAWQKKS